MENKFLNLQERLTSIDVMRGIAMFLILSIDIGGAPIFETFTRICGEDFAKAASSQFNYSHVTGLRLCFLAQPMFIFVVGLVMPFSLNKRYKNGKGIYGHIVKRSLILFVFGLIAGGHLLHLEFSHMPVYNNVLEYISIAYLVCAVILLNTNTRVQIIITALLLLVYWLIFLWIPFPGALSDPFSDQMNLAVYVDNVILGPFHSPGSCRVLATISFIANALLGVLMGKLIFSSRDSKEKVKLLIFYGIIMLIAGIIWGQFFPVIRLLWTSSFVLVTCGLSTLLLALLYQVVDIWKYSKWAFFFIVFGVNSIAIYMMAHLFDFRLIGDVFIGGISRLFGPDGHDFIQATGAMIVMWLIVYMMFRKKIFLKV